MNRHILSTIAMAALCALGCGGDALIEEAGGDDKVPAEIPMPAGLRALGFDTVAMGSKGTPVYLAGEVGEKGTMANAAEARLLLARDLGAAYRLAPGTDFAVLSDRGDRRGQRYVRLKQLHGHVPVFGAEVVVHISEGGQVAGIIGQLAPDLHMTERPLMDGAGAVERALSGLARDARQVLVHEPPALEIFLGEEERPLLCYRAVVEYVGDEGRALDEILVSARDGALLARFSRIYHALDRKIYNLGGACLRMAAQLPGMFALGEGGSSMDPGVKGAFDNTGITYWFYHNLLERDSFDDAGASIVSTVNLKFGTIGGCTGNNAAWMDSPYNQMVYGTGDDREMKNLALSLDVTAHEVTHAVTSRTSKLTYANESGALNEAMSDIIGGAGTEAWSDSGGSAAGNPMALTPSANTWKIGEAVAGPALPGGAMRFMANPTADNYSKDYYPERLRGTADHGGVHGNSGIANLAFVLLTEGGTHPRGKTTVRVEGIGMENALSIYYLANTYLFTSSTDFRIARYATAHVASALFGRCSSSWASVHRSWDAVGVPGAWTPCLVPRRGF